ncbi:GntR family transcriptional regulator [Streptomyces sp. NPDC127098]|uniref:GntR family transcriptional regulator n=1 Tax=Streptomyces sp. NPDC127098 TaxID=3347137 RepID=UPI00365255DB
MSDHAERFVLKPASLTDALFDSLRKRIVNGQIAPGEKLTEARVATEYSVARPTAKACLERLIARGLLRRSAHKSAVVPELTAKEILDLFLGREAVESFAVTTLAARGAPVPPDAVESQRLIERAVRDLDFPAQVESDILFHSALVAATGSTYLAKMHDLIMGEVQLTMGQAQAHKATHPSNIEREHAAILAGIESGDPEAAHEALLFHLHAARDRLVANVTVSK